MTLAAQVESETADAIAGRPSDVLHADALIHLCLMAAITFGCFQGWLKDRIAGPLPYALSDGFLLAAAALWFASVVILRYPLLVAPARTAVDLLLVALVFAPMLYLFAPGTPLLIELAGLRAWSAFPVAAMIALSILRTSGQLRAYVVLVLTLCIITGAYGIWQYAAGPELALATPLGQERHGSSVFFEISGTGAVETDFRAFSTFAYPAPFAAMMTFGLVLCGAIATSRNRSRKQRLLALALMPLFFVAMTVSGTRAALIMTVVGLGVVAWYRGFRMRYFVLLIPAIIAVHIATVLTSGRAARRFLSLLVQEGLLWSYVTSPIRTAWSALGEHWFGLGLGRTGTGVPFAIASSMPPGYFVFSDGDIGRAAIELGIVGLMLLAFVVFGLIPRAAAAARRLKDGADDDVAIGTAALILSGSLTILIGSPLSATPHAIIWWFFFGALLKLQILREHQNQTDSVN
ncbi:MAG TPA: hypothetical protein VNL98_07955 [Gemmatimonadales bacterium]|nr:hypothetical protein [Gemmatimonadales bacterium]